MSEIDRTIIIVPFGFDWLSLTRETPTSRTSRSQCHGRGKRGPERMSTALSIEIASFEAMTGRVVDQPWWRKLQVSIFDSSSGL